MDNFCFAQKFKQLDSQSYVVTATSAKSPENYSGERIQIDPEMSPTEYFQQSLEQDGWEVNQWSLYRMIGQTIIQNSSQAALGDGSIDEAKTSKINPHSNLPSFPNGSNLSASFYNQFIGVLIEASDFTPEIQQ